jgi:hypothetical protein
MVFYVDDGTAVLQNGSYRFYYGITQQTVTDPAYYFERDMDPKQSYEKCFDPSLMYPDTYTALRSAVMSLAKQLGMENKAIIAFVSDGVLFGLVAVLSVLAVALISYRSIRSKFRRHSSLPSSVIYQRIPEQDDGHN